MLKYLGEPYCAESVCQSSSVQNASVQFPLLVFVRKSTNLYLFLIVMSNLMRLKYRGYTAILQQDLDSAIWHGRVADIRDIVSFEGKTAAHAEAEFRKAVDVYLACCQLDNRNPNQSNGLTSLS